MLVRLSRKQKLLSVLLLGHAAVVWNQLVSPVICRNWTALSQSMPGSTKLRCHGERVKRR